MKRTSLLASAAALGLALCSAHASAEKGTYLTLGVGLGMEETGFGVFGVNHPTRCDRLLYADAASAPTDAACTDDTADTIFQSDIDFGTPFVATVGIGYDWEDLRVEGEFLSRSHGSIDVPALPGDNPVLQDKQSEWSPHAPPNYRISGFHVSQFFANAYYAFYTATDWTPVVGVGIGLARIQADIAGAYQRRTLAEGYVASVGGDPNTPTDWQIAAAGTVSRFDSSVSDEVPGYQLLAGVERTLSETAWAFAMLRWTQFEDLEDTRVWSTVRSHAPVQADGATPFTSTQTLSDIGGLSITVGLRYKF